MRIIEVPEGISLDEEFDFFYEKMLSIFAEYPDVTTYITDASRLDMVACIAGLFCTSDPVRLNKIPALLTPEKVYRFVPETFSVMTAIQHYYVIGREHEAISRLFSSLTNSTTQEVL